MFILMEMLTGGEPEDNSGIQRIVATGTFGQVIHCLPEGYQARMLDEDEELYLEFNIVPSYRLLELAGTAPAEVINVTDYFQVTLEA